MRLGESTIGGALSAQELSRRSFLKASVLAGALPLVQKFDVFFAPEIEASKSSLITVKNGQFHQNGRPIGFIGENWWSLGENQSNVDNQICGPMLTEAQRKQWILDAKSLGMNIVRFWDFPELTANGRDTRAADQVVALAAQHGLLVYPTLENHFRDCTGSNGTKPTDWYANGYKKTYLPYVEEMTRRYKGDHRIFGFQLINEAQCDNPDILRNFAFNVLNAVKEIDPQRLVTINVIGVDQPGVIGGNFKRLFTPRNRRDHHFDFADIHLWPGSEHGSYHGLPGDSENGIWTRIHEAAELGLPTIISEQGRQRSNGLTDQQAAQLDRAIIAKLLKIRTFAGLVGWALLPRGIGTDNTTYDVYSPEAQMLKSFSSKMKDPRLR